MKIERHFTAKTNNPYDLFTFHNRVSEIKNPDGTIVFQMNDFK